MFQTITKMASGSFLVGYNHQINQFVVGVEGDVGYRMVGEKRYNQAWGDSLTAQRIGRPPFAAVSVTRSIALCSTQPAAWHFRPPRQLMRLLGLHGLGDQRALGLDACAGGEYAFARHWIRCGVTLHRLGTDTTHGVRGLLIISRWPDFLSQSYSNKLRAVSVIISINATLVRRLARRAPRLVNVYGPITTVCR